MKLFRLWFFVCFAVAFFALSRSARAHPMGNFSINHYARFEAQPGELRLRYVLDFAEIPAIEQMAKLDANKNDVVSVAEKKAYLQSVAPQFLKGLSLEINGKKVELNARATDLQVIFGAGNLPTLLVKIDTATPLIQGAQTRVNYQDSNFADRTGWKEVVAVAANGAAIADSDAATKDQSHELTVFPIDAGVVPPRQDNAHFSVVAAGAPGALPAATDNAQALATDGNANGNTPQNRFTQSIAEKTLTPTVIVWGLLIALTFGAVHALAPGHGKTMVAAYLVGSRGTPRHAITLGLIVTITHTFGVFALGFALLISSHYIVTERLYPVLSALSGMTIFGVGLWLFMSRYQGLQHSHSHAHDGHTHEHGEHTHDHSHGDEHSHSHEHGEHTHSHSHDDSEHAHSHDDDGHDHAHDEEHIHSHAAHSHTHAHSGEEHAHVHESHSHSHDEHDHAHDDEEHTHAHGAHAHSHAHDEEHAHSHDHDDDHDHSHSHGAHVHSHGGKAHSHAVPAGPITMKTLVALGVSGGILPCPEAIVVLLAAVKLHRIGYGMILILAFSIGLAAALIAIGLLVVSARNRMTQLRALNEDSVLVRYLPLASAAIITLIGAALTLQATLGRV